MKKKNLIFLTLLISVLMISVVSASITGYLVRGGTLLDEGGYRATLTGVEGSTAVVSVQTPSGDTELVRVEEGKTAKVGEAEISASSLTRGNLFRRGGANIEIARGPAVAGIATGGSGGQCGMLDCEWKFSDAVVNPANDQGAAVGAWCDVDEIAFQGSCYGDGAYSIFSENVVGNLIVPNSTGSGWGCEYQLRTGIVVGSQYTLETGALCCKV